MELVYTVLDDSTWQEDLQNLNAALHFVEDEYLGDSDREDMERLASTSSNRPGDPGRITNKIVKWRRRKRPSIIGCVMLASWSSSRKRPTYECGYLYSEAGFQVTGTHWPSRNG